jgi:L-asparaginase
MTAGPRIAVVFTGGTISMLLDPATGTAVPTLDGAAILARTPGLDAIALVEPIDWGLVPASHLRFAQILDIARLLRDTLARPDVDGAVLVQGTDVIEETAFAFDLLVDATKPLAVVGAMRSAADPGYDGPANLRAAIRAAASPALAGQGTVVVMGGQILPADDVTKTHSDSLDTFQALNLGPLGHVVGDRVVVARGRAARRVLPAIPVAAGEPVPLITATVATDGALLRLASGAGARGIVVAATGAGNTDPDLLLAAQEAMAQGIPVVHATRCPAGRASGGYGFPGGGATWLRAGAIPCGYLGGPKARIALALGLGAGLDDGGLRALLSDR